MKLAVDDCGEGFDLPEQHDTKNLVVAGLHAARELLKNLPKGSTPSSKLYWMKYDATLGKSSGTIYFSNIALARM